MLRKPVKTFKPVKVERAKKLSDGYEGMSATYRVNVTTTFRGKRKTFPMIEKTFPDKHVAPRLVHRASVDLRQAGVNAVVVKLIEAEGGYRCLVSDISRGGKFRVVEWVDRDHRVTEEAKAVSNIEEIQKQIQEQSGKASEAGYYVEPRVWMLAVPCSKNC